MGGRHHGGAQVATLKSHFSSPQLAFACLKTSLMAARETLLAKPKLEFLSLGWCHVREEVTREL
eukprot:COSAG06_NODE_8739_length_2082_cov_3.134644_2_plen_64_part_00